MKKYSKFKKQYEKYQQTIKYFDKLYRKNFKDNLIDRIEYESLSKYFTKYLVETKTESFL